MMTERDTWFGSDTRYRAFTAVKYIVYLLLCVNVYLFLQEELLALEHTFVDGFEPGQIIQVFSATIDTAAWVILLLLFELETSVLDDARLQGRLKWVLMALRGICYFAIAYAFLGYLAELMMLYDAVPFDAAAVCALAAENWSLLLDLDEYAPVDAQNCLAVSAPVWQLTGFDIVADGDTLQSARWLAWTDVVNSAAWILVVIVLEVEVFLQVRGDLSNAFMRGTRYIKFALYGTLFGAAAYWGVAGDFLDFWDAALWLFAFIFIELNVFEWQYETSQQATTSG